MVAIMNKITCVSQEKNRCTLNFAKFVTTINVCSKRKHCKFGFPIYFISFVSNKDIRYIATAVHVTRNILYF